MPCTTDTTAMRNITPMNTPMRENRLFNFWARICCSASRTASKRCTSGRSGLVRGDEAVAQRHYALGVRRDVGFVRHHHHGLPLAVQCGEHVHDLAARGRVEV